ncbi:transglutaminase domain-containing protein [Enterococcus timonensis]|uniref:transglutaminase domain-containing protein n=1 Tax=Enterococcus timonensis TaxID=1852364 RepID=UPI0008D902E2|nr:transglutaminase domain-containing protein [Enterococcus timonensis]
MTKKRITQEKIQNILATLFLFLALNIFVDPLFQASKITGANYFRWYLLAVCLLALFTRFVFLQVFLSVVFGSLMLGLIFDLQDYVEFFRQFLPQLVRQLQAFFNGTAQQLPASFSVVILMILFLVLIFTFVKERYFWPVIVLAVGLLFFFETFANQEISNRLLLFLIFSLAAGFFQKNRRFKGLPILLFIILSFGILAVANLIQSPTQPLTQQLIEKTARIRDYFNQQGLYARLDELQGNQTAARQGFSEDDQKLGGPLLANNEIVFEVEEAQDHYWRVDAKKIYTGEGWADNELQDARNLSFFTNDFQTEMSADAIENSQEVTITFPKEPAYLPLPYGTIDFSATTPPVNDQRVIYNLEAQRYYLYQYPAQSSFTYTYVPADFSPEILETITKESSSIELRLASDFNQEFTALPEIPQRVTDLAQEITTVAPSYYQQVLAVENYLKNEAPLRYSKIDAEILPAGADYVDFFLFDSQVGYCDNFSTSMVVLLRTLEIPARFVKGFSGGLLIGQSENGVNQYRVTNNQAHSWVEVYFEGMGWVPFEPTKTFTGQQALEESPESLPEDAVTPNENSAESPTQSQSMPQETEAEIPSENSSSENNAAPLPTISWTRVAWIILTVVLVTCGVILYVGRYRLEIFWFSLNYHDDQTAFLKVVQKLQKKYPTSSAVTLREYEAILQKENPGLAEKFEKLQRLYEGQRYGQQEISHEDFKGHLIAFLKELQQMSNKKIS